MTLRILGGELRGRRLMAPKGCKTRPTSSLVKKAFFDICQDLIVGSSFLDLFAGSGAMGIEALSRGAKSALFIESSREALESLRSNLLACKLGERSQILPLDVLRAVEKLIKQKASFDLVYIDPPYEATALTQTLVALLASSSLLRAGGQLFLEQRKRSPLAKENFPGLKLTCMREYGSTALYEYHS